MNSFLLFFYWFTGSRNFSFTKIGGVLGALNTVSLIFLTAIIGLYLARLQGIKTIKSGLTNLYQNKMPVFEIVSEHLSHLSLSLIVPFFTDFVGFLY